MTQPHLRPKVGQQQFESLTEDPLWFKDAIVYELHIRAFSDSNGDGIGDLNGLTDKLDYLQDLGVTALWLLPFYPSPLRDGGYDIADYTGIHESYGTRRDFSRLLREAHRRGIRVITELVLNHTSTAHPWFERARTAPPGSKWRNFYVWSDTPERYTDARIIFRDFETSNWAWDPVAKAYYWHRFYSHQPDLNFENPDVQEAMFDVVDFWMDMGVDGLRLDAVPYLYEREGTSCENLPETHGFLKRLRAHIDGKYKNRMLLAEANQWPADAAAYFGEGDECHMNFHFPLMPRMFMAVELEDSFPIVNILRQTPPVPESCQWATFLRNHDELTLEMVTDEDRDYMYRIYATDRSARVNLGIRRRLAPLLGMRRKVELLNALLLSLPGTPVLYYGDEIGMGDNIYLGDRDGVRTPMQWSADRNAGFSRANPQKLYLPIIIDPEHHYEAVNVEAQQANPSSLLWWTKRIIALRKEFSVFGRGSTEFLECNSGRVLAFVRRHEDQTILVVANLSRFVQYAELDLSAFAGSSPVELFGRTKFPTIGQAPYLVTLASHGFYWFLIESPHAPARNAEDIPTLTAVGRWSSLLEGPAKTRLASTLLGHISDQRWFRGKARVRKGATISELMPLSPTDPAHALILLTVDYADADAETYFVPISFASGAEANEIESRHRDAVIARVAVSGESASDGRPDGILFDALLAEAVPAALLRCIHGKQTLQGTAGTVVGVATRAVKDITDAAALAPKPLSAEQSNTTLVFGERLAMKIFRLMESGPNCENEMGRHLAAQPDYHRSPRLAGTLEYRARAKEPCVLGVVHEFVPNRGDGWRLASNALTQFFDRLVADDLLRRDSQSPDSQKHAAHEASAAATTLDAARGLVGPFTSQAALLGTRTAELHLALSRETKDPAFAPEPFTIMHQQSLYQSAHGTLARMSTWLRKLLPTLTEGRRALVEQVLAARDDIETRLGEVAQRRFATQRIRCHGDYHLGQVLWTGEDFYIIDFEGEPARPPSERRYKRCPLRDVAGMMRSFEYAAATALRHARIRAEDAPLLEPWVRAWTKVVTEAYVEAYLEKVAGQPFLPATRGETELLLEFYMLEKCMYEVGYELNNRPEWIDIPLHGLLDLLRAPRRGAAG